MERSGGPQPFPEMAGWIDVSRPLEPGIPVWPGDVPFELVQRRENGLVVSSFSSTCHVGTHLDAPLHLEAGGPVDTISLDRLIGPAEVVRAAGRGRRIGRDDLPPGWRPLAPRVLVATGSFPVDSTVIDGRFQGLAVELVQFLGGCGTVLVGIDTPSVDPLESEDLEAHHALAGSGLTWIEGLALDRAPAGLYHMVALPLALVGTDGAPARVVLRPLRGTDS